MGSGLYYFATRADFEPVLREVCSKHEIVFTRLGGAFDDPVQPEVSPTEVLGSDAPRSSALAARFLVTPRGEPISAWPLEVGWATKFCIDQTDNPASVILSLGGLYTDDVVIRSHVATIHRGDGSTKLFKAFTNPIKRRFVSVNGVRVGPEALEVLKRGGRLTMDVDSPTLYDLAQPD